MVSGKDDITKMFNLFKQAQAGADPMQDAYGKPAGKQHTSSKKQGVRIPFSVIPQKEARRYLEYTILGAIKSGNAKFDEGELKGDRLKGIQVEPIGNDILIYFSPQKNTWHKSSAKPKE